LKSKDFAKKTPFYSIFYQATFVNRLFKRNNHPSAAESADKAHHHMNKKYSSRLSLVLAFHHSCCKGKKTDKHRLAFFRFYQYRNKGKL